MGPPLTLCIMLASSFEPLLLVNAAACAEDLSPAGAAVWLEALEVTPGSIEALNRDGLLCLLQSGTVQDAAALFEQAWQRSSASLDPRALILRLASAKNLWWAEYTAEDSGSSDDREHRIDDADERIYDSWKALAKAHVQGTPMSADAPAMSVFDMPLQRRICRDPMMFNAGGPWADPPPWRERYLDLLKRSVTNHLYREQAEVHEQVWDVEQGASGVEGFAVPAQGHTVMRAAALTHLQLLVDDIVARGVAGDVLQAGVFRGGAGVLLRAVLDDAAERKTLWLADSFAGIPLPRTAAGKKIDESADWEERCTCMGIEPASTHVSHLWCAFDAHTGRRGY